MKKVIAFFIIAAIVFSFPGISLAAEKKSANAENKVKTYEISLDSIDEIMFKSGKYFNDSQERKQRLMLDQSKYEREIRKLKKEDSGDGWGNASSISSLYDQLRTSKYNLQVSEITETANLKKQALTAKSEYLKYIGMKLDQELLKNKAEQEKQQDLISQEKYKRGLISLTQYKETVNKTDYSDEISESEKKLKNQIDNVKNAMGLKDDDKVQFKELKDFDLGQLNQISLDKDTQEAMKNSKDILLQEMKVEHLKTDFVKDRRAISDSEKDLTELKDTVKKNFKKQYELIDTTSKKVNKSIRAMNDAKRTLDIAKAKYDRGLMSKKDFDDIKVKNMETVNQGKAAEIELQEVFLTYQSYKEGYQGSIGGSAS